MKKYECDQRGLIHRRGENVVVYMKIVSWNVRDLREELKKTLIRRDLGSLGVGWVVFQETKL